MTHIIQVLTKIPMVTSPIGTKVFIDFAQGIEDRRYDVYLDANRSNESFIGIANSEELDFVNKN